MGRVLLVAEVDNGDLSSGYWEQVSAARQLSAQTGWAMHVLVIGHNTERAASSAARSGAEQVIVVDDDRLSAPWPEAIAGILADFVDEFSPDAIVMPRSVLGSEVAARLAAKAGVGMALDATSTEPSDEGLVVTRPVSGGAGTATIQLSDRPWIILPRIGAFAAAEPEAQPSVEPVARPSGLDAKTLETIPISHERQAATGIDLDKAQVIVAGGRGMGGPEPFELLAAIADRLGGAVAASRPPCDTGWVEPMIQVGLTGKTVAPDLYMAVGISGATQHMTGCTSSRVIVAINNDPDAPIFRMASYGVIGDWQDILPDFLEALDEAGPASQGGDSS